MFDAQVLTSRPLFEYNISIFGVWVNQLHKEEYSEDINIFHAIMLNNGFPTHTHKTPTHRHPTNTSERQTDITTHKWVSFTHIGKETTFITSLFKKTKLKIALKTNNTIQSLPMTTHKTYDMYTRPGAYKLTCPDCHKTYVGQTAISFLERFNEHKSAFKTNSHTSNYAKHILEKSHSFGRIHNTSR